MGPLALLCGAVLLAGCITGLALRGGSLPSDVRPEYFNGPVTALAEDCESVRLALGAAWDDAHACRAMSGYLRPWAADDSRDAAEAIVKRGAALYERVKCVDDGIQSVRLARDSRDEPALGKEIRFWRNELALAAADVTAYADAAAALKATLQAQLAQQAAARGIAARTVEPAAWENPQREAWRKAGPATGIRLPLDPPTNHPAAWWNRTLSVGPLYIAGKFRDAGETFFTAEQPLGAWDLNGTGAGTYDFSKLTDFLAGLRQRRCRFLLELPTLTERQTDAQQAEEAKQRLRGNAWIWTIYAPSLPDYLAADEQASLIARGADGSFKPSGQVQLFNPAVAKAYGEYLMAMGRELRRRGLYETVAAVHLEMGDSAHLSESVDYSTFAEGRWRKFMEQRYGDIGKLNASAGTSYKSFGELKVPVKAPATAVQTDWDAWNLRRWQEWLKAKYDRVEKLNAAAGTTCKTWEEAPDPRQGSLSAALAEAWQEYGRTARYSYDAGSWGRFLTDKYKTPEGIRTALSDDFREGYGWRLPLDYPPVIKTDYLHFRREYVQAYLDIKRKLVEAAFPGKLIIAEMRQFGDHDMIAGRSEETWGGFLGASDDIGQFSGVGPRNETLPFMIRSVGPPGFGTRPSDSLESLFRDYLWLNFRDPGNLARYFYVWVCHGYMDYQAGWHDIHNHWLTDRLVYSLGPTVAATAPQPQRIGLMLPRSTFDLYRGPIYDETLGWDWLLGAAKLAYTRVDERLIREGWLTNSGLEMLVLPGARAMDTRVAAAIEEWVAAGGTLLCSTLPGREDEYGRPLAVSPLAKTLGAGVEGTVSENVKDSPLTVTIPRGIFSGGWAKSTDRKPAFEALRPETARVLAAYEGGKPAITLNAFGKGKAVLMGYPLGVESVTADRTSVAFYRTYTFFTREPQLVARVAWLRRFVCGDLGFRPEFGVDFADVERFRGKEAAALGLGVPKGFSQTDGDVLYVRTVGDPRGVSHEIQADRETPDMALRFFPRWREGMGTRYLGISTREVHYIAPRGGVNMYLSRHGYRCRIENPRIEAMWDVARNVPVGFEKDAGGVSFNVSLPSGHIMMLAYSESPGIELVAPAPFPGRDKDEVLARCKTLAGGTPVRGVTLLTAAEIKPWIESLKGPIPTPPDAKAPAPGTPPPAPQQVIVSYGDPANKPAAERLVAFLRDRFHLDAAAVEQCAKCEMQPDGTNQKVTDCEKPVIFIGNEWSNNDLALHGAYWNWPVMYGPHLPFTATYAWPGRGRCVVSLSRRYALRNERGDIILVNGTFNDAYGIRKVEDRWPLIRRKLHIAGDGEDAQAGVDALIELVSR